MTKDYSTEVADLACRDGGVQIRGGDADTVECPVERHSRVAEPASITEDTSEVQHLAIGRKQGL